MLKLMFPVSWISAAFVGVAYNQERNGCLRGMPLLIKLLLWRWMREW